MLKCCTYVLYRCPSQAACIDMHLGTFIYDVTYICIIYARHSQCVTGLTFICIAVNTITITVQTSEAFQKYVLVKMF